MPTLSEFILTIGLRHREADNSRDIFFRFQTVREFQAFRYEVEVEDRADLEAGLISFTIKGVRAPVGLMSNTGSAVNEFVYPPLVGDYSVTVSGAKQSGAFRLRITPESIELIEANINDFVQIRLADEVEVIRA